jgi:hypothetical protein
MPNEFRIKNGVLVDLGGASITGSSAISGSLGILSSGSNIFTIDGTTGRLFSVNDSLSGSLFSVNTIAGLPVIEAFSDNIVRIGQYGQKALYVSQSRVAIGKEGPLTATLDISGSLSVTGSIEGNLVSDRAIYGSILVDPVTDQNNYSPTGWNDADPGKATTINLSSSNSVKITGLAGGSDGRMVIMKNVSPDRLIILEDSSSLSTAGNRFNFRNNPIFLTPSSTVQMMYDGFSSTWLPIGSSGGIGYGAFFNQQDEFTGQFASVGGGGPFVAVVSGAAATASISSYLQNTTEKPLGILQGSTGTTATGRVNIGFLSSSAVIPQQGQAICLSRVAAQQLSTAAQAYLMYSGWHNSGVNPISASNGIFWQYISGSAIPFTNNRWMPAAASSSLTVTSSTFGPVVDLTYAWLGIYVDATWRRATYFYSTDSRVWTIAAEISSTAPFSVPTGFGVHIGKLVGTTAVLNSVDFLAHRYDIDRG